VNVLDLNMFGAVQGFVGTLLYIGALALVGFALFDAIRTPERAFPAAGKKTKNLWLVILGIAAAVIFVVGPLNILGMAGVVGAGVYMVDVRPAVKQIPGRGNQEGPYGPW
jgi:hypothetical protein